MSKRTYSQAERSGESKVENHHDSVDLVLDLDRLPKPPSQSTKSLERGQDGDTYSSKSTSKLGSPDSLDLDSHDLDSAQKEYMLALRNLEDKKQKFDTERKLASIKRDIIVDKVIPNQTHSKKQNDTSMRPNYESNVRSFNGFLHLFIIYVRPHSHFQIIYKSKVAKFMRLS